MSSFRPDPAWAAREFVPLRVPWAAGGDATFRAQAAPAVDAAPASSDPEAEEPPAEERITAEQLAEAERDAFERGAASVRKDAETLDRACTALELGAAALEANGVSAITANRELLLDLAIAIARRWVEAELVADRGLLAGVLDRALDEVAAQRPTRLRLHPEDLDALLSVEEERLAGWRERFGLDLVPDPGLAAGEFALEAERGFVDGGRDALVDRLRSLLGEALGESTEGLIR